MAELLQSFIDVLDGSSVVYIKSASCAGYTAYNESYTWDGTSYDWKTGAPYPERLNDTPVQGDGTHSTGYGIVDRSCQRVLSGESLSSFSAVLPQVPCGQRNLNGGSPHWAPLTLTFDGGDYEAGTRTLTVNASFELTRCKDFSVVAPHGNLDVAHAQALAFIAALPETTDLVIDNVGTIEVTKGSRDGSIWNTCYTGSYVESGVAQTSKIVGADPLHDRLVLVQVENYVPTWPPATPAAFAGTCNSYYPYGAIYGDYMEDNYGSFGW
jgi:hypothetical protein